MDFCQVKEREGRKKGVLEVYPDFRVVRSRDIMVRANSFYAIWDEKKGLWSTDEYDVPRLLDEEIQNHEIKSPPPEGMPVWPEVHRKLLGNFSSNSWLQFRSFVGHLSDSSTQLDEGLTFLNQPVRKEDYVSRKLPYALAEGDYSSWDELLGVLYIPEERAKIEWAIGAIVAGDSKTIQKFLVFYGPGGTGKSTVLNIIEKLFVGYVSTFDAKALTSGNNAFSTEVFRNNPLVVIQQDGDLSKIEDNTKFNSIVSHEMMTMNEKYKPSYDARVNAFAFMGTNKPVRISDAKSGLIRRLIDVHPSGEKIPPRRYQALVSKIDFELGAIAQHCLDVYREMGKNYYETYRPTEMMLQTDVFFNFIEAEYEMFSSQDGITLKQAFEKYKEFIVDTGVEFKLAQYKFREELRNYFDSFEDRAVLPDGTRVHSWYSGFKADKFKVQVKDDMAFSLVLDDTESLFDTLMADMPAQYSKADGFPRLFWTNKPKLDKEGKEFIPGPKSVVQTKLSDLDTSKEHYVKVPENHIIIDFDLADETGEKSLQKSLEAASQWPSTYAELSKSGNGIHLHYEYQGDVSELSRIFEPGIEIKVYTGDTSLRRRLTKCNNIPVASISSGLPLREKKVMNEEGIKDEKHLRALVLKNLRKEIHPGTKPSMDYIYKLLEDAYNQGLTFDLSDMRSKILQFAGNSSHQALYCMKLVQNMRFKGKDAEEPELLEPDEVGKPVVTASDDGEIAIFDLEVFPNLFVICWKFKGAPNVVRMINPTPQAVEELFKLKLVGYNNRRYDNHILWGAMMGLSNEALYNRSKKIIDKKPDAFFGEAYNISYTDIFDFASAQNKKSLKKYQIDLDLNHSELGLDWDAPVPEELWDKVAEYCANDVVTTEQVFDYLEGDWIARQILSQLSGLSVNETTNKHSIKIIFGNERRPQDLGEFKYKNLAEDFAGYEFDKYKKVSTYRGEITGEGGYVYAEPGMYEDVAVLDIQSMHPTTIEQLDLFGSYTKTFSEIKNARVAIKRKDFELARTMMDGKLAPFLEKEETLGGLSDALKTVINSVYGLTSASFDNPFRDPRNIDNIVAKRGALFMIDLKYAVQELGFKVIHIKTDSIKVPNATKMIIDFIMEYGKEYGYIFEHEATYKKMALVNDAVYVAKVAAGRKPEHWEAVGAQFQHPYVFKTLFSKEPIKFKDMCETKQVQTALYLDFNEETDDQAMALAPMRGLHFVGKSGSFVPIQPGKGGATLVRLQNTVKPDGTVEQKYNAAPGSTGYRWLEAEMVKNLDKQKDIDLDYFRGLVDKAITNISQYGDFEAFVA
jgi:hypothetical protein